MEQQHEDAHAHADVNIDTSYVDSSSLIQQQNPDIRHQLVDLMPSYPTLWNPNLRAYKDLNKKDACWREISIKMNVTVDTLKKEWNKLRDNYRKTLSKREKATRSGSAKKTLPTCNFFEELSFLRDSLTNRTQLSNIPSSILSQSIDEENNSTSSNYNVSSHESEISDPPAETSPAKRRKRSNVSSQENDTDFLLMRMLDRHLNESDKQQPLQKEEPVEDGNKLFCFSLLETIRGIDERKNTLARIKIQQVLFDIKFV